MKRWGCRVVAGAVLVGLGSGPAVAFDWTREFSSGWGVNELPAAASPVQDDRNGNLVFVTELSGLIDAGGGPTVWMAHTLNGDGKIVLPSRRYAPAPTGLDARLRGLHAYNDYRTAWFEVGGNPAADVVIVDDPYAARTSELYLPRTDGAVVLAASGDGEGGALLLRLRSGDPMPRLERHVPMGRGLLVAWATPVASCGPGTSRFAVLGTTLDIARGWPPFSRLHVFGFCDARPFPGDTVIRGFDHGSGAVVEEQRFDDTWAGASVGPLQAIGDGAWLGQRVAADGRRDLVVLDAQFGEYSLSFDSYSGPASISRVPGGALMSARLPLEGNRHLAGRLQRGSDGRFVLGSVRDYPALAAFDAASVAWTADAVGNRVAAHAGVGSGMATEADGLSVATMLGFDATGAVKWVRTSAMIDTGRPVLGVEPLTGTFVLATGRYNMRFGIETTVLGHRP